MATKKASEKPKANSLQGVLAELRKDDKELKIGSLADFQMNSHDSFSTGNLVLDSITGVGGFPRGRVIELYGPSQSGKTTSALQAAAIHQKRVQAGESEGAIVFLDYERSLDEKYCAKLGLDINDSETFIVVHPRSFEHGANVFRKLLSSGFIALGIADSVAAMVSEKELGADTGAATMGDRAKALHQFMRQITGELHDQNATLVMLNHVMDVIDISPMGQRMSGMGIKRKTTPGGTALPFYSSMRIEFKQIGTNKTPVYDAVSNEEESIVTSTTVEAKVVKNKVSIPQRVGRMRVRFGAGFSQPYSALQVLVNHKVVKKAGSWYTFPADLLPADGIIPQGEEAIVQKIERDPEWLALLVPAAKAAIQEFRDGNTDTIDLDFDNNIDPDTGEVLD